MITTQQLTVGAIVLALALMFWSTKKESLVNQEEKNVCRSLAKKKIWKKYDWQQRKQTSSGVWKCAQGWEDTQCNWGMGKEFEKKQCRRLKSTTRGIMATAGGGNTCGRNNDCLSAQVCINGKCENRYNKKTNPSGYCTKNSHCSDLKCLDNKCSDPVVAAPAAAPASSAVVSYSTPAPFTSWTLPNEAIEKALAYNGSVYTACNINVQSEQKPLKILENVLAIPGMSGAFVIVAYLNSMKNKADATGHVKNYHIECQAYESDGDDHDRTKGYDIYIWAPGTKGNFTHKDNNGFPYWAMNGGKFNENWRWGKDRKNVAIDN